MPSLFTHADILCIYGFCNGNARDSRREYPRRFSNRRTSNKSEFSAKYRRLSEHGTVHTVQSAGRVEVNHEDTEQVLERFEADPTLSVRKVANDLGILQWKVWCTMRRMSLHPCHYTSVQHQCEQDLPQRLQFYRFLLDTDIEDELFLKRILWTDES
ncbi:hypothetical protein QE152_g23469 [Popillia japonica]|uniref:DUF4817 domain-containing protein n=1 Tax=Popillia japonica TaxID=7064 RepID=A0AAW1KGU1_POPJA